MGRSAGSTTCSWNRLYPLLMMTTSVVALTTWATLLLRVFAAPPLQESVGDHPGPSTDATSPCACKARSLWAPRVVLPGGVQAALLQIAADGRIASVLPCTRERAHELSERMRIPLEVYDDYVMSPGVIDAHAHLGEMLQNPASSSEGFESGTQAAAAGGITTVIDLPAHSQPATTNTAALRSKMSAARGRMHVDLGFWGGIVAENALEPDTLNEMLAHGALGLSTSITGSPDVQQPGMPAGTRAVSVFELEQAFTAVAHTGRPVLVHSELLGSSAERLDVREIASRSKVLTESYAEATSLMWEEDGAEEAAAADVMDYRVWLSARPRQWEEACVNSLIELATKLAATEPALGRLHLMRISDAAAAQQLKVARAKLQPVVVDGLLQPRISASTCPHYASFEAEAVERGDTRLKSAPPLRDAANRRALWQLLLEGGIGMLASDHTPSTLDARAGSFLQAFTGVSGLQFILPATWTVASLQGASLLNISRWLSEEPAKLAGLWARKGSLEVGKDADVVLWAPEMRARTSESFHRHQGSPYEDSELDGRIMRTLVRGRVVFRDGHVPRTTCGEVVLHRDEKLMKGSSRLARESKSFGHRAADAAGGIFGGGS